MRCGDLIAATDGEALVGEVEFLDGGQAIRAHLAGPDAIGLEDEPGDLVEAESADEVLTTSSGLRF